MKKTKLFSLIVGLLISFTFVANAQLLEENFSGSAGDTLANGWVAHSVAASKIVYKSGNLSYTNYPSNSGNSVYMGAGQDYNKDFTTSTVSSGNLYCAMLVNIDSAKAAGDYFFHTYRTGASTSFFNRIYVRKVVTGNLQFGILKGNTTANIVWSDSIYALEQTHLLVLKVEIVAGTTNDIPSLIINPVINSTEPAATITATDIASTDYLDIDRIALRQGGASTCPKLTVDGIRVATNWSDAVIGAVASSETDIITFNFTSPNTTGVVDPINHTVTLTVPYGTDITALSPSITLSQNATISPLTGVAQNFTAPVSYIVTAENGTTTQNWTVTVNIAPASSVATLSDLTSGGSTVAGFAASTYSYNVELPYGTSIVPTVTAIASDANATFVINAATSLPGVTSVVVTAQNGTTQQTYSINYTIAVQTHTVTFNVVGTNGSLTANVDAATISSPATVETNKNVIFVASPSPNYSVKEWKLNGTIVGGNTSNTFSLNNITADATVTVEFKLNVGISETNQNPISIFPNPVNDVLNTKMNNTIFKIEVLNMNGKIIMESIINNMEGSLNTSSIANGMYFLRIETENGITMNKIQIIK